MPRQMDNPLDGRGRNVKLPKATWVGALQVLLLAAREAQDPKARADAEHELERMALAADIATSMHLALTLARFELREDLAAHVRSTTRLAFEWQVEEPLPSTFCDPEMEQVAQRKKAALESVDATIAAAEGRTRG
ncbi:hypothetical protein KPL78_19040 [Roseomonas sp. HJA6]|uniref:Uncharacterized protein n=1 Tax=Roseomonas alba TaxID=2846776 RepID=A0ABS7AFM0_9PROT|nr:hypothetical protein [Neoroseomonas alba]MBW6399964.1 hypothetical protein [Neoroseomonas alba]